MYASQQHAYGCFTVSDQRAVSREAAERFSQISAIAEARRRQVSARREARSRRSSSVVIADQTA